MKKTLMLTTFVLAGLAAAQTTTTPAPAVAAPVTAPAVGTDTSAPASTDAAPTDTAPADTAPADTAPTDTAAPSDPSTSTTDTAAPADASTTAAPTDTSTAAPVTGPATAPVNVKAQSVATQPVAAPMSSADHFAKAQEYAVQADVAYPVPFYDRTLWKNSVDQAYYAASAGDSNRDYNAYLAQLYTKTQWWINAYTAWNKLGDLNNTEKQWASLSAAKLAYLALQHGDRAAAAAYVAKGQGWADSPSLQAIKKRL